MSVSKLRSKVPKYAPLYLDRCKLEIKFFKKYNRNYWVTVNKATQEEEGLCREVRPDGAIFEFQVKKNKPHGYHRSIFNEGVCGVRYFKNGSFLAESFNLKVNSRMQEYTIDRYG